MKQKALVISGCIAAISAPAVSVADILPENLVGLNLGEVRSSSFLNEPFKGVIPFLFTSTESSQKLSVKLAPEYIFNKIGAERHPILSQLNFQITQQKNKPVILISSQQPINLPFLNFVLELKDENGTVYQDYTVLLDPAAKESNEVVETEYINVDSSANENLITLDNKIGDLVINEELLASLSARIRPVVSRNNEYRVKGGDSLSKIAQKNNPTQTSLQTISRLIYQKNPNAFIGGDVNKIKKGVVLTLPTASEVKGFALVNEVPLKSDFTSSETYQVTKGDTLGSITKIFAIEGVSFTKLMNEIYLKNKDSFVDRNKNKLKLGAVLNIPKNDSKEESVTATISSQAAENNQVTKKAESSVITNKIIKEKLDSITGKATVESVVIKTNVDTSAITAEKETSTTTKNSNSYLIKKGDSLTQIARTFSNAKVPYTHMLKALFKENQNAFADGNINSLKVGEVIVAPPLSYFQANLASNEKQGAAAQKISESKKIEPVKSAGTTTSPDLIKRIRQLRKELDVSKKDLFLLQKELGDKELLLNQKNFQLENLTQTLSKYKEVDKAVATKASITDAEVNEKQLEQSNQNRYQPKSEAEFAKLKSELVEKQKETVSQLQQREIENSPILPVADHGQSTNSFALVDLLNSTKNQAYIGFVIILGLLLVRYRRKLYSYSYSAINYNQPKYYQPQEADNTKLYEKNINHSDPKEDEVVSNYEVFTKDPDAIVKQSVSYKQEDIIDTNIEPKVKEDIFVSTLVHDHNVGDIYSKENSEIRTDLEELTDLKKPYLIEAFETDEAEILNEREKLFASDTEEVFSEKSNKVVINPLLVEARDDIFAADAAAREEALGLDKCDDLVTELFENPNKVQSTMSDKNDWKNIEEMCDDVIERSKEDSTSKDISAPLVNGVDEFNDMMSDLLDGLNSTEQAAKSTKAEQSISADY